jgi:hypothetical protein
MSNFDDLLHRVARIEFFDSQAIATIEWGKFGLLPLLARCNMPNSTYDPFRY